MSTTVWIIIGAICVIIWLFFWALCQSTKLREEAWRRAIAQAEKDKEMKEDSCH